MVTGQQLMENKIKNIKENNQISILIRQDGYSFLIEKLTEKANEVFNFKLRPDQHKTPEALLSLIKESINSELINDSEISKAKVLYHHSLYSLSPIPYFQSESASDFIKYNTKILPQDQLISEKIETVKAVITFIPFTNINNYFIDLLGGFQYQHSLEPIIKINAEIDEERERVLVFIDQNIMSLSAFSGKKMILANTFSYQTEEDLAYYILFCIEQIGFDRQEMILLLFGSIQKSNKSFEYLFNYIKHVDFLFNFVDHNYTTVQIKSFQLLFEENYAHSLRKI